jgi:hypothetical protein
MQHRSVERIAGEADVLPAASLAPRDRLERWAEVLERHPARLRAIPEVEHGGRRAREARRVNQSPLTVAYADPVLRAAGLRGDTIGAAAGFFGLSQAQLHHLVCGCQHGPTLEPQATAVELRALTQRAEACTASILHLAVVGAAFAVLLAAAAVAGALF